MQTSYPNLSDVTKANAFISSISLSQLSPSITHSHECFYEQQTQEAFEKLFSGLDSKAFSLQQYDVVY